MKRASWALQDAKNRLSEVVSEALENGPQVITRRGQETAVVVSYEEWTRLSRRRGKLIDVLRRAPKLTGGLDVTRSKDTGRDIDIYAKMAYLIDTCALSEFTKPKPSASVDAWFASLPEGADFISVLTLGEIEKGITKLTKSRRRAKLERWCAELRDRLADRILGIDAPVALEWGRISARAEQSGEPIPIIDALLGATAIVHGLVVVTRNTSDVARTGAPIVDPWHGA